MCVMYAKYYTTYKSHTMCVCSVRMCAVHIVKSVLDNLKIETVNYN